MRAILCAALVVILALPAWGQDDPPTIEELVEMVEYLQDRIHDILDVVVVDLEAGCLEGPEDQDRIDALYNCLEEKRDVAREELAEEIAREERQRQAAERRANNSPPPPNNNPPPPPSGPSQEDVNTARIRAAEEAARLAECAAAGTC